MRIVFRMIATTFVILLLFGAAAHNVENQTVSEKERLLNVKVERFHIQDENIPQILAKIANDFDVPIGIEVSPNEDLLKPSGIQINIQNGTVTDLLDAIAHQTTLYSWRIRDHVINFYPVEAYRDPLLNELLETSLDRFFIDKNTSLFSFRKSLTGNPKIKIVIKKYGVSSENEIFISRDMTSLGPAFTLDVSNMKVRELLNRVISESRTKYWVVNRYGENRKFLLVNL